MNATVIFPSPNWFQVSGVAISIDGWLIYGGPSKSLCVLEPLNASHGSGTGDYYHAHVVNRAHAERIVSVDISQEWPDKKLFLTASADGSVKQWSLECVQNVTKIKSTHWLDTHQNVREEVTGVGYSSEPFAISVGTYGNVVKWDLNSNVAKTYHKFLKKFRPTCMSCSHHVPLTVAVGTKQGVVFVLDLNGPGNVVYKVRGQDDEIVNVSWCPQYEVLIRKSLKKYIRKSSAMKRLEKIRSEVDDENINDSVATELSTRASEADEEDFNDCGATKSLPDDSFDESIVQEDDTFDIYKDHEADEFGHKKFVPKDIIVRVKEEKETDDFLAECLKLKNDILKMKDESDDDNDNETVDSLAEALDKTHMDSEPETSDLTSLDKKETTSETNNGFSSHVQRHVLATIGKYGGIRLWSKTGKLIGSCVVANTVNKKFKNPHYTTLIWYKPNILLIADGKSHLLQCNPLMIDCKKKLNWRVVHSLHKRGLYCVATNAPRVQAADRSSDQSADRSSDQSAERSSDQSPDQWRVWTVGQDRSLICYSMEKRAMIGSYNTSGSSIFTIQSCPYDAKSVAISVGDGAVRVWETDILEEDETKLSVGHVTAYWQNVQGKVLTVAWHPTRENLIAFATAESRVGLIEASGKGERAARTLAPALRGAVYALCWGDEYELYASGGGRLVMFRTNKPDEDPVVINVEFEGQKWEVCSVNWYPRGMLCGSIGGAVAVLDPHSRQVLTVAFVFGKMIHSMEWHPEQTSSSSAESPFKDLIAVSSLDKCNSIAILEYADKGDGPKLHKLKSLTGHTSVVLQLAWNPHKEAQLLSTSHDCTVRVWDVPTGECYAIYGGHVQSSLGAAWCALPQLPSTVLSGGADCCLRVWRAEDHPAAAYKEIKHDVVPKKDKKQRAKTYENTEQESAVEAPHVEALHVEAPHVEAPHAVQVATTAETKFKASKRFLLPNIRQQMWQFDAHGLRRMAKKLFRSEESCENNQEIKFEKVYQNVDDLKSEEIEKSGDLKNDKTNGDHDNDEIEIIDESTNGRVETDEIKENEHMYIDFLKIFGSTNELNELLDLQMHRHLEHARFEAWSMLAIFRGHIDATVQAASQRDALCPFLVSIAPCVSFKYWKDVTQLYLAQIERLVARGEEEKVGESPLYGGSVYRRAALLLSLHDPKGAAAALVDARLFPEAYVLAKSRHLDGVAQDVLRTWGDDCVYAGRADLGAMCYLALGELDKAAVTLAKSHDEKLLGVAAELAKAAGQPTFAAHIEDKKSLATTKDAPEVDSDEDLKELPTRIDLLKASIGMGDGGEN